MEITPELSALAAQAGIREDELSNAIFWLNANADGPEKRPDFRSGPETIRTLLRAKTLAPIGSLVGSYFGHQGGWMIG